MAARKSAGLLIKWLSVSAKNAVEGVEVPRCSRVEEEVEGPVCNELHEGGNNTKNNNAHLDSSSCCLPNVWLKKPRTPA